MNKVVCKVVIVGQLRIDELCFLMDKKVSIIFIKCNLIKTLHYLVPNFV